MEQPMHISTSSTANFLLDKPCQMSCNFCYARFDEVIRDTKVKACGSITHALVIIDEAKFIARGGEYKI